MYRKQENSVRNSKRDDISKIARNKELSPENQ